MEWVSGVLAIGCLAVGLLHLYRLSALRDDVAGEASYAAMGLGMAAMFSPLGDPVSAHAWIALFLLSAAGVVVRGAPEATHHVLGAAAMLFMLLTGHEHGSVVGIALAAYFAWHVLRCLDRLRAATEIEAVGGTVVALRVPVLRAERTAAVAHLVMSVAMAVMLLGML
jgi:hypothetical protein